MNFAKLHEFAIHSQRIRANLRQIPAWEELYDLEKELIELLIRKILGIIINPDEIPNREIWGEIEDTALAMATELNRQEAPGVF